MLAASNRAVFLSYASSDRAPAQKICEALRAAGVEVWFDQNELTGGDAWDHKIRRQVRDCVLFLPVISAATQARREGYFRLEWKLADDRTHLMAKGTPFLVPVCIDDTKDADALVPDSFMAVQWTRLPGGETPEKFCARVKALLGEELPDVGRGLPTPPSPNAHSKPAGSGDPALQQTTRHIPAAVWAIVAVVVALIAFIVLRPRRSPEEIAQLVAKAQALAANAAAKSAPATPASPRLAPAPTAPVSPAREWVAKARALYEPWDFATPEDFKQAEQFLKRAIDLDPSDAEAWASLAILSCGSYFMPHDRTPARAKDARFQAERAVKLAPNSDYALFAQAFAMRIEPLTRADAIRRLRELVARQPRDKLMSRILGAALAQNQETEQEGLAFLARAAALPGGDPIAEFLQGDTLRRDRYDEAIAAYDRALALAPNYDQAHRAKISVLLQTLGDPIAARAALEKVSPTLLHDDRMAAVAVTVWFAVNEPERVLRVLDQGSAYFARIYLNGPTAYWKGLAHRRAGRLQAAQVEWRVALKEVQRLHEANPTAPRELLWKARLHALLGERKEAETALALHGQFVTQVDATTAIERLEAGNLVDTPDQAVREITELFSIERNRRAVAAAILFDPALDPVRDHPQFAPLVEQAKAYYAEVRKKSAEQK